MIQYQQQQSRYLETTVATATPAQLLIMLCDGAIKFCRGGIEAIRQNNTQESNRCLLKAQNIISEFIVTLDRGIPVSEKLASLYEYFNRRLVEANIKKDIGPVEEVMGYLLELKEVWMQASKLASANSAKVSHA